MSTLDLEIIKGIVCEAGVLLKRAHLNKDEIFEKEGDANFVTVFDMKIQKFLIERILEVIPDAHFFGEEEEDLNKKEIAKEGYTFIIDPIDGTTNFMFGYNQSCISVGVAKDGELFAGIIYNPYVDEMFYAEKGKGAFLNGNDLIMADRGLSEGISCFGCARYNESSTGVLFATVQELFYQSLAIRSGGSAAIDLARIASGANVSYVEMMLQPYDYAAAAVIIEEAGGVITQIDGKPITIDKGCSILAGTKKAHAMELEILKSKM